MSDRAIFSGNSVSIEKILEKFFFNKINFWIFEDMCQCTWYIKFNISEYHMLLTLKLMLKFPETTVLVVHGLN